MLQDNKVHVQLTRIFHEASQGASIVGIVVIDGAVSLRGE
jgi:hypothetical protein